MNYANHDKICKIVTSCNNFFMVFIFTYIKMSKDSSAIYYQNNKERLQKKLVKEDTKVFLKNKKKKTTTTIWS